jgi:hypothetical protein
MVTETLPRMEAGTVRMSMWLLAGPFLANVARLCLDLTTTIGRTRSDQRLITCRC